MEALPIEIIIEIFNYLDIKNLIKMQFSKKMKKIVRENKWKKITVKLVKKHNMENVKNNYSFIKYDLNESKITDKTLIKFKDCHMLNLSFCYFITDESIKQLKNCSRINVL